MIFSTNDGEQISLQNPHIEFQITKNGGKYIVFDDKTIIKTFSYKNRQWQKTHADANNFLDELVAKLNES